FNGLTYGLAAARAWLAFSSMLEKLGFLVSAGAGSLSADGIGGAGPKLNCLNAARSGPKTSSRMCPASSAGRSRKPQYSRYGSGQPFVRPAVQARVVH